jgi:hypothetical protein
VIRIYCADGIKSHNISLTLQPASICARRLQHVAVSNRLTPAGSCIDDRAAVCTLTQPMERRIGVWVRGVRLSLGTKPNAYHVARLNSAKILSSQQLKCIHAYEVLTIRSMQEDPSSVTHASPYVGTSVEHHHQILFSRGANNITQTQSRTDIGIDNRTCRDTWGEPHKLTPTS